MLIYLNSLRLNFFPELNRISDKLDIGSETGVNDSEVTRMQQGLNLKRLGR